MVSGKKHRRCERPQTGVFSACGLSSLRDFWQASMSCYSSERPMEKGLKGRERNFPQTAIIKFCAFVHPLYIYQDAQTHMHSFYAAAQNQRNLLNRLPFTDTSTGKSPFNLLPALSRRACRRGGRGRLSWPRCRRGGRRCLRGWG